MATNETKNKLTGFSSQTWRKAMKKRAKKLRQRMTLRYVVRFVAYVVKQFKVKLTSLAPFIAPYFVIVDFRFCCYSRAKEFLQQLEGNSGGGQQNKSKVARIVKEVARMIAANNNTKWASGNITSLDRLLNEMVRIMEKRVSLLQLEIRMTSKRAKLIFFLHL